MRHTIAIMAFAFLTHPAFSDEVEWQPASRDCVRSLETGEPIVFGESPDDGEPRGDSSAFGTQYDVSHFLGTNNPTPACFPALNPGPGSPPDDVVTFDGMPEQTRRLINNVIPVVVEQEIPMGPGQFQLMIQSQSPPGSQLFPGGVTGPQGQPLTDGCFFVGLTDPLAYNGPKSVANAVIQFTVDGAPFMPPMDVTPMFSDPWDGTFGIRVPGLAGSPVNGVVLNVVVILTGDCVPPCNDGDPCTIDECVGGSCVYTPIDCDDGNECTFDYCIDGNCGHTIILCDDEDDCTVDSCDPAIGCIHKHLKDILSREEALQASHGPNAPCFDSGGGCPTPELSPVPFDPWQTNDDCDGHTAWRVGMDAGSPAIPGGFFGPGSDPFTGEIPFKGLPLGLPGMGGTDTVVERSGDPFDRSSPPDGTEITVEIELVQLSLVSCQPIVVTYNGGATSSEWDVAVTLSDCPPAPGSLTARKSSCNGGTFTSSLPVQPKLTFTRVNDPLQVHVLDTGCVIPPYAPDVLGPATPVSWVHDIASNLTAAGDYSSSFHAGFPEGQSTSCGDYDMDDDADGDDFKRFLQGYGSDLSELPQCDFFYMDYDASGAIDHADFREWLDCHRCMTGDPAALAPAPPGFLGDFTGDGHIRGDDAQGYADCFTLGSPGAAPCDRADINQDGVFDERDVPGFVLLLLETN